MSQVALVAIGGNSLIRAGERGTIEEQLANAHATEHAIFVHVSLSDGRLLDAELIGLVRAHLDALPEGEATLIRRHYLRGEDIDDVARDMGLSKSWGSLPRISPAGLSFICSLMVSMSVFTLMTSG